MPVPLHTTYLTRALARMVALCFALSVLVQAHQAEAKGKEQRYVFLISKLELPKNAPEELESLIRSNLTQQVDGDPKLLSSIPKDAPAYDDKDKNRNSNKAFRRYMAKQRMEAFKVIVQVTKFERSQEADPKKSGHIIGTAIELRIFGETVPYRVMAFAGDGSARVLIEVGKKIRDKDRQLADSDAVKLAVADALAMSLTRLAAKPADTKKKKRKKRRKKKKKN